MADTCGGKPLTTDGLLEMRKHLGESMKALDGMLAPPKPEGVIRKPSGVYVATTYGIPPENGYYLSGSVPVRNRFPVDAPYWILARRPDAPPEGYEWDEVLPWGAPHGDDTCGVTADGTFVLHCFHNVWRCKLIPKPEPKPSEFTRLCGCDEPSCVMCAQRKIGWNAFADAMMKAEWKGSPEGFYSMQDVVRSLRVPK